MKYDINFIIKSCAKMPYFWATLMMLIVLICEISNGAKFLQP